MVHFKSYSTCTSFSQDFVTGLSLSLYGSREEKMKWAFQLYDLDGDGYITREVSESLVKIDFYF